MKLLFWWRDGVGGRAAVAPTTTRLVLYTVWLYGAGVCNCALNWKPNVVLNARVQQPLSRIGSGSFPGWSTAAST